MTHGGYTYIPWDDKSSLHSRRKRGERRWDFYVILECSESTTTVFSEVPILNWHLFGCKDKQCETRRQTPYQRYPNKRSRDTLLDRCVGTQREREEQRKERSKRKRRDGDNKKVLSYIYILHMCVVYWYTYIYVYWRQTIYIDICVFVKICILVTQNLKQH